MNWWLFPAALILAGRAFGMAYVMAYKDDKPTARIASCVLSLFCVASIWMMFHGAGR